MTEPTAAPAAPPKPLPGTYAEMAGDEQRRHAEFLHELKHRDWVEYLLRVNVLAALTGQDEFAKYCDWAKEPERALQARHAAWLQSDPAYRETFEKLVRGNTGPHRRIQRYERIAALFFVKNENRRTKLALAFESATCFPGWVANARILGRLSAAHLKAEKAQTPAPAAPKPVNS